VLNVGARTSELKRHSKSYYLDGLDEIAHYEEEGNQIDGENPSSTQ